MGVTAAVLDFDERTPERAIGTATPSDMLDAIAADVADAAALDGIWTEAATQGTPKTGYVIEPDSALSPVNPNLQILFCGGGTGPANNLCTGQVARVGSIYVGVSVNGKLGTLNADILNAASGQVYTDGTDFSGWAEYNIGNAVDDLQWIREGSAQALAGHMAHVGSDNCHMMLAGAFGLPFDDTDIAGSDKQIYLLATSGANYFESLFATGSLTNRTLYGNGTAWGPVVGYDRAADTWVDLIRDDTMKYSSGDTGYYSANGAFRFHRLVYRRVDNNVGFCRLRQAYVGPYSHHKRDYIDGTSKAFAVSENALATGAALYIPNFRV